LAAESLDEVVELGLRQNFIEFGVEGMARPGGQIGGGDEEFVLFGFASAECHSLVDPIVLHPVPFKSCESFLTGC
jgi:hypothetical protein